MELKAIPTHYDGHHFRSRLEARWAVFFNELGIRYEYEREGYDLDGVRYLPDFWLPAQQSFVEVKGDFPNAEEQDKVLRLAHASGKPVYICVGEIKPWSDERGTGVDIIGLRTPDQIRAETGMRKRFTPGQLFVMHGYDWCECPYCGMFDIAFEGLLDDLPCGCFRKRIADNPLLQGVRDSFEEYYEKGGDCEPWYDEKLASLYITSNSPRLTSAFNAARRARFEFGQSGA